MDYDIAVSPEQLLASADSLRAMADDCCDALPTEQPAADANVDQTPVNPRPRHAQDEVAAAGQAAATALLGAVRQASLAVQQSSAALRATAADYQAAEQQASELINQTIGRALGESR